MPHCGILNGLLVAKYCHANAKDLLVFGSLGRAFRTPISSVLTRHGELVGEAAFRGKLYIWECTLAPSYQTATRGGLGSFTA